MSPVDGDDTEDTGGGTTGDDEVGLFDGALSQLLERFSDFKTIGVTFTGPGSLSGYGEVLARDGARVTLRVPKAQASQVTARLLAEQPVDDLTVEDTPIDDVIEKIFSRQSAQGEAA